VLERRNSAIMLPKLYIVPLDKLLGIFHRGLIVGAHKSNCWADKTVFVHDVLDTRPYWRQGKRKQGGRAKNAKALQSRPAEFCNAIPSKADWSA
jgi:hypothetical protein